MDTRNELHPRAAEILVNQIHRISSRYLDANGTAFSVCRLSIDTIAHFLPLVRDHDDPEVRRIAAPLLAMLGMTVRNVAVAMTNEVVSEEGLRKTFEEAGVMDDEIAYALSQYKERLRYDEWQNMFGASQASTSEADTIPEMRPQTLAEAQRNIVIDESREMVVDSHDDIEAEALLAQIADLDAARRGEARVSLEKGYGYTLRVEGERRTVFYLRVGLGDAEDLTGAAVALATAVLKAQLQRIESGEKPARKLLEDRLRSFMEATHAAHPGDGIGGERYRLSLCYPTPFHEGALGRSRSDQRGYHVMDSDEWLTIAADMATEYAALPYGYKLKSATGWKPAAGTDTFWVDGLCLIETVPA